MEYEKIDKYLTRFKVPNGWIYQSIWQNEVSMVFVPEFTQSVSTKSSSDEEIKMLWQAIGYLQESILEINKKL
jgi:Uma2 family endonuclease